MTKVENLSELTAKTPIEYRTVDGFEWCQLRVSDNEFVEAQRRDHRISIFWPTNQTAEEAIGHCLPEDLEGVKVLVSGLDNNDSLDLEGSKIVEFLAEHQVGQVMLYKIGSTDQITYTRSESGLSEMSVSGSGFNPNLNDLFLDLDHALTSTGTPGVRVLNAYIFEDLLPVVDKSLQEL